VRQGAGDQAALMDSHTSSAMAGHQVGCRRRSTKEGCFHSIQPTHKALANIAVYLLPSGP
jgi:hypothetical protein